MEGLKVVSLLLIFSVDVALGQLGEESWMNRLPDEAPELRSAEQVGEKEIQSQILQQDPYHTSQEDSSIAQLLNTFQSDDAAGNYFHHDRQDVDFEGDLGKTIKELSGHEQTGSTRQYPMPCYEVTKEVVLAISQGGVPLGKILIGLFGNIVPKTAANFAALASHEAGFGYRGSPFHRIIKDFMVQGGDITRGDGTGGRSIYGDKFNDENFNVRMNGPGWACMANAGPNTNDSQFFITTADTPWLVGKHVCFGKVLRGMDVVNRMQNTPKSPSNPERPQPDIIIQDSGVMNIAPFSVPSSPGAMC